VFEFMHRVDTRQGLSAHFHWTQASDPTLAEIAADANLMPMISITDIRLFLHLLAATVWVGGQIVLAGLLPTVRTLGEDAPRQIGRAYNRIAWPAFALIVVTGIWNLFTLPMDAIPHPELEMKLLFVVLSGAGAAVHQVAHGNKAMLAIGGAASSIFAVLALLWGIALL
jgi:putative copper export protein